MTQTVQFDQILQMIDYLSWDEQDDLSNIVKHRQTDKRREQIVQNISQARQGYQNGNVFRENIDTIVAELNND